MKKMWTLLCILLLTGGISAVALTGCGDRLPSEEVDLNFLAGGETYEKSERDGLMPVEDLDSLYTGEDEVKVLYLTVGRGSAGDGTNHTWEELHSKDLMWYQKQKTKPYQCEAVVQFGNEEGPVPGQFGYGVTCANATVRLSGLRSSSHQQKNYRINIKGGCGNVDGMKSFVLSKGFSDPFRFTNKLCYELMEEIPQLLSTRTGFVHLYIKDVTQRKDTKFVDHGLYTMVEPINKRYLTNRNLDHSGELYKAVNFDWARHQDILVQPTDAGYSEEQFEQILESKGSNNYSKLLAMLEAVNNRDIPIEDIVDTYFDKENLYTWMAFNILVDNKDTDTENYYIYSPTGTNRFSFIAWDNDGALRDTYETIKNPAYDPGWERGIFLYTDSVLFRRILQSEHCVNELSERIHALHSEALRGERVEEKAEKLARIAKEYIYKLPDMSFARVTGENYDGLISALMEQMDVNYYAYYDSIETPWPFHIGKPVEEDGRVVLTWDSSFLLEGDITYMVELDTSWEFKHPIVKKTGLRETTFDAGVLKSGQYFVRITAVSEKGNQQRAMEYYHTEKKTKEYGVLCFYVMEDGTVTESVFQ